MSNDPTGDASFGPRPPPRDDSPEQNENPYAASHIETSGADESKPLGYVRLKPHRSNAVLAMGLGGVIMALVGGVVALMLYFCCPLFLIPLASLALSIPAWIMGQNDLAAMKNGQMDPSGRDTTTIGMICGIVGAAIVGVGVLIVALLIVIYVFAIGLSIAGDASV